MFSMLSQIRVLLTNTAKMYLDEEVKNDGVSESYKAFNDFNKSNSLENTDKLDKTIKAIFMFIIFYLLFFKKENTIESFLKIPLTKSTDGNDAEDSLFSLLDLQDFLKIKEFRKVRNLHLYEEFLINTELKYEKFSIPGIIYENLIGFTLNLDNDKSEKILNVTFRKDYNAKKTRGVYYTPLKLAEKMIEKTLLAFANNPEYDIQEVQALDLASGCGVFSLCLFRYLLSWYKLDKNENYSSARDKIDLSLHIATTHLYAVDRDFSALEILRFVLMQEIDSSFSSFSDSEESLIWMKNIVKADVLEVDPFKEKLFNIVISNPPYVSFYSRQSVKNKLGDSLRKQVLAKTRINSQASRVNLAMFILEYGYKKTGKGGLLTFIHDISMYERSYEAFRKWMLTQSTIVDLIFGLRDFGNVNSGQLVVVSKKTPALLDNEFTLYNAKTLRSSKLRHSQWARDRFQVQLPVNRESLNIIEKIQKHDPLKNYLKIRTGVNVGGSSNSFIHAADLKENRIPYVNSRQLKRPYDSIENINQYLDFDQHLVKRVNLANADKGSRNVVVLGDISRFKSPKIFLRQSSSYLCATLVSQVAACSYSLFVLFDPVYYPLELFLAILNSSVLSWYSQVSGVIRSGPGKQPQIRKSDLDTLPIPVVKNRELIAEVVNLVGSVYTISESNNTERKKDIIKKIDRKICQMYNLTSKEVDIILNEILSI